MDVCSVRHSLHDTVCTMHIATEDVGDDNTDKVAVTGSDNEDINTVVENDVFVWFWSSWFCQVVRCTDVLYSPHTIYQSSGVCAVVM